MRPDEFLEPLGEIGRHAGDAILHVYEKNDHGIEKKGDDSPITEADLAAHDIIVTELEARWPDIPVLSEESGEIPFSERAGWSRYFLVDPLDGTKEFISRNGEFTVNIALIDEGEPVAGIVFVPVRQQLYAGAGEEAWCEAAGQRTRLQVRALQPWLDGGHPLTVVASRRHGGESLKRCMDVLNAHFPAVETTNMGSSLKLCLVAAGQADLYPRLAPTSEWDTAAAHAVVLAAGGEVVDTTLAPLRYNRKADLLNPHFYVIGDPGYPWGPVLNQVGIIEG